MRMPLAELAYSTKISVAHYHSLLRGNDPFFPPADSCCLLSKLNRQLYNPTDSKPFGVFCWPYILRVVGEYAIFWHGLIRGKRRKFLIISVQMYIPCQFYLVYRRIFIIMHWNSFTHGQILRREIDSPGFRNDWPRTNNFSSLLQLLCVTVGN